MDNIETIYDIFDKIDKPSGKIFIPTYINGKEKGEPVSALNHKHSILLGQLISEDVEEKYTLLPTQRSYDIYLSKSKETKPFRKAASNHWSWRREAIKGNILLPDPVVIEQDDELVYIGDEIDTITKHIQAGQILSFNGFFTWKGDILSYPIRFDNNESAFGSGWRISEDHKFCVDSDWPCLTHLYGFTAYEKTPEKTNFNKIKPKTRAVA